MSRAVFVDRDGTINKDVPYCGRPEDFELFPGVVEGIRILNEHGFKVIVITNQSGIARGYFTKKTLASIHQKMCDILSGYGAFVDAIYFCPHHPDEKCQCRKPETGLFYKAAQDFGIDFARSYVVGDSPSDIAAARKLSCKCVLVTSASEATEPDSADELCADFVCKELYSAARWIISQKDTRNHAQRSQGVNRFFQAEQAGWKKTSRPGNLDRSEYGFKFARDTNGIV